MTVVLTGDGGDELFAGYLRFGAALAADWPPRSPRSLAVSPAHGLPSAPSARHLLVRRSPTRGRPLERMARWNSLFRMISTRPLAPECLQPDAGVDPLRKLAGSTLEGGSSPLSQLLAANFTTYLPDDLLVKTDRCTMAHSLEARSPLLDTALAEYAATLPDTFKLSRGRWKAILRDAFADLIPADIDRRPKTGFGVPLDRWFRGELRDFVRDTLLEPSAALRPCVRRGRGEPPRRRPSRRAHNAGHRMDARLFRALAAPHSPTWSAPAVAARDDSRLAASEGCWCVRPPRS